MNQFREIPHTKKQELHASVEPLRSFASGISQSPETGYFRMTCQQLMSFRATVKPENGSWERDALAEP
jgi:hypothetical protein